MDQPHFSCTKCFRNFPQSEMSRSKQNCNPNNSSFKQCNFCKSDFKHYINGSICPRCSSLREKFGEPKTCTICQLSMAFGNALVCQRCLHYRSKFGEPTACETCHKVCAFIKDSTSREKVDGKILCWVCTYNFKLVRNKEANEQKNKKPKHTKSDDSHKRHSHGVDFHSRRSRTEHDKSKSENKVPDNHALDSVYNDHLLKISSLQDEIHDLQSQLEGKRMELIKKDNLIAELKTDIIDLERMYKDKIQKIQNSAEEKQDQLVELVKQLQKEKTDMNRSLKKRKSGTSLANVSDPFKILKPLQKPHHQIAQSMINLTQTVNPTQVVPDNQGPREGSITPPNSDNEFDSSLLKREEDNSVSKKPRFVLESSDSEDEYHESESKTIVSAHESDQGYQKNVENLEAL